MAVVQDTDIDKNAGSLIAQEDVQGYYYTPLPGNLRHYTGAGTPNGVIGSTTNPVPLGSLYVNRTDGKRYYKATATTGTVWTRVGS